MITGEQYADAAISPRYEGIPYSKLDCQAFVEQVLKDCGVTDENGNPYNWRGSNAMWRQALSWKGTIAECREKFGTIPPGAWCFIVKDDGKEQERGYHDKEGNASHVGIVISETEAMDSTKTKTRDGVGMRALKGFTHIGLPKMIQYGKPPMTALEAMHIIRSASASDADMLQALLILTEILKGV